MIKAVVYVQEQPDEELAVKSKKKIGKTSERKDGELIDITMC